ncbi:MAG: YfiR family protein [Halieaceae bacterium]|nr:YfiR family protein [Halieaceae bacterium]
MLNRNRQNTGGARKPGRSLLLSLLFAFCSQVSAGPDSFTQSELNVALLYNVTKFVRWPESSFSSQDQALTVCAFASADYEAPLAALEQRNVNDRPIQVRSMSPGQGEVAKDCHVLFFANGSKDFYQQELQRVDGLPVLTVGDFREFTQGGGMLSLSKSRKRVNIEINIDVSESVGLEYNSQLLELAKVIKNAAGGKE